MATLFKKAGNQVIQFVSKDGDRRTIGVGRISDTGAEKIKARVEKLNAAAIAGVAIDQNTAEWASELSDALHAKIAKAGLIAEREKSAAGRSTLGAFIDQYIASRTDIKPNTKEHLERARRNLVEFFGVARPLKDITAGHADEFRLHLRETMAPNTVARICGRAKQFFRAAVRKKLIRESPFGDMKGTAVKANKEREFFVTPEMSAKVIEACPDLDWRVLFALCRWGGLRCPSETLSLKWADVDWERNRIRVTSPKTEHHEGKGFRWIPIFPELRPHLEAAFDSAPTRTVYVVNRYRDKNANLRTTFERILRNAGLEPWQKPFQNLRSTRETELAESYPVHVVCAWIGNSATIAAKHYLQVTDEHFAKATAKSAALGAAEPNKSARNRAEWRNGDFENPRKNADSRHFKNTQAPRTKPSSNTCARERMLEVLGSQGLHLSSSLFRSP